MVQTVSEAIEERQKEAERLHHKAAMAADDLRQFLKLEKSNVIISPGPSPDDPCGEDKYYVSFVSAGNGFWFAVDVEGNITRAGANIKGRRYIIPLPEMAAAAAL